MSAPTKPLCIGVGELLWDLLPGGKQLGGAPANFAYHTHALGAEALVVSRVGTDALGREILDRFRSLGLSTEGVTSDSSLLTGTVSVSLDARGTPTFTIHENVAWDFIEVPTPVLDRAAHCDAICFGSLAQRRSTSRAAIRSMLLAPPTRALRIFDINLRQHFWSPETIVDSLELANVAKLNDDELPVVAGLLRLTGSEESQLRQLAARFGLKAAALTKGAKGSVLLVGADLVSHPGAKLDIVDTVGAGDSYTAALTLGLLAGYEPQRIIRFAHRVADHVCTQAGAMPPLPELLRQEFEF
jgi:fructokinase